MAGICSWLQSQRGEKVKEQGPKEWDVQCSPSYPQLIWVLLGDLSQGHDVKSLHTVGERSLTYRGAKSGGHPSQAVDSGQKVSDHPRPKHPPAS